MTQISTLIHRSSKKNKNMNPPQNWYMKVHSNIIHKSKIWKKVNVPHLLNNKNVVYLYNRILFSKKMRWWGGDMGTATTWRKLENIMLSESPKGPHTA